MPHGTEKVESTVTIAAELYAQLMEDSRILDIYDMPGMIFARAGEVRRRGRIMARSPKRPEDYIAFRDSRKKAPCPATTRALPGLGGLATPDAPRPSKALRPRRAGASDPKSRGCA